MLPLELDFALTIVGPQSPARMLPEAIMELVQRVDPGWLRQWTEFIGPRRPLPQLLGTLARLAGAWFEADYDVMAAAIRNVTLPEAVARLRAEAVSLGFQEAPSGGLSDQFAQLLIALDEAQAAALGLEMSEQRRAATVLDAQAMARALSDSDHQLALWRWLDRFYFDWYLPWRQTRAELMASREEHALAALGARQATGLPPLTDWLPPQSPLRRQPMQQLVAEGLVPVRFMTEPFGLADAWAWTPTHLIATYAEFGPMWERYQALATDIATGAKALSDPTRLAILRTIRNFSMDNTSMASYLGLARPTVSIHAKVLREAGLIQSRQEGREVRHSINAATLRKLFEDLEDFLGLSE